MSNLDDKRSAEQWMVERYGQDLAALTTAVDVYMVRRHVRDAYAAGLADGRDRALRGIFKGTLGEVRDGRV